jgi:hypothetical protein
MFDRPDVSLGLRRSADGVVLVDRSCGSCASCTAAAPLWCLRPEVEGRDLTPPSTLELIDVLGAALASAAALVEAPAASTVLVIDEQHGPLATLVRALVPSARIVVSPDPFDPRTRSALADLEPSGRAPVVVAGRDARAAVKVVRRGGHVCVGDPGARMPSITELVQREVTLVGPRDLAAVVRRAGESAWAAAVTAAA